MDNLETLSASRLPTTMNDSPGRKHEEKAGSVGWNKQTGGMGVFFLCARRCRSGVQKAEGKGAR